jgi:RNA methyltransferase, TrmH family
MVSKNQIKLITSLDQKKFRQKHKLFIAEGVKVIQELLLSNIELEHLYVTEDVFGKSHENHTTLITETELRKISCLSTPNNCLAVFKIPDEKEQSENGLIVALDDIRDPGNFGTIIRLCDWFGIEQIICSEQTVDVYNPKVIQSTMGSIARVNVSYVNLANYLTSTKKTVFGTFMTGRNVYTEKLPADAVLVLGNEANGISIEVEQLITQKLAIPRFGAIKKTESLNVATATAIFLSEFKRGFSGT